MISVLLADDQALVRAGFRVLIESAQDLEVVGEAATGDEAVAVARVLCPNVVLMDIRMPGLDGIEATRQITMEPALDDTHVLILTTFESDENIFEALRAGRERIRCEGHGTCRPAPGDPSDRRRTRLALTDRYPPGHRQVRRQSARLRRSGELDALTDREREVLTLVAQGLTNEDIAMVLVLSAATVKTHINRIRSKLAIHDRAQLVVAGYEAGLVVPGA